MQYDPKLVICTVGGVLINGWAEDSFIEIEYDEDLWSKQIGADGYGIFSKSNNLSATVTVKLMPGAYGNTVLSARLMMDISPLSAGFFPFEVIDRATATTHTSLRSRIMKPPSKTYSKTAEALEWTIGCLELITLHGMNINPAI
jgi:hypothetical protein